MSGSQWELLAAMPIKAQFVMTAMTPSASNAAYKKKKKKKKKKNQPTNQPNKKICQKCSGYIFAKLCWLKYTRVIEAT